MDTHHRRRQQQIMIQNNNNNNNTETVDYARQNVTKWARIIVNNVRIRRESAVCVESESLAPKTTINHRHR